MVGFTKFQKPGERVKFDVRFSLEIAPGCTPQDVAEALSESTGEEVEYAPDCIALGEAVAEYLEEEISSNLDYDGIGLDIDEDGVRIEVAD